MDAFFVYFRTYNNKTTIKYEIRNPFFLFTLGIHAQEKSSLLDYQIVFNDSIIVNLQNVKDYFLTDDNVPPNEIIYYRNKDQNGLSFVFVKSEEANNIHSKNLKTYTLKEFDHNIRLFIHEKLVAPFPDKIWDENILINVEYGNMVFNNLFIKSTDGKIYKANYYIRETIHCY